jgi:hypothetical protein
MLSKCANPECDAQFQYLREGQLYQFEIGEPVDGSKEKNLPATGKKPPRKVEHFWLCSHCSATMTLALQQHHVVVVQRRPMRVQHANAS